MRTSRTNHALACSLALATLSACGAPPMATPTPVAIASVPPADPQDPLLQETPPERVDPRVLRVSPGFGDPMVVDGVVSSAIAFDALHPGCVGAGDDDPNHIVDLAAGFSTLVVFVASNEDTTLVVQAPDGRDTCNDDDHGLNPGVQLPNPPPGRYQIWVGTYDTTRSAPASYRLGVSTNPGANASLLQP